MCIPLQIVRRLNKRRSILHAEKCIFLNVTFQLLEALLLMSTLPCSLWGYPSPTYSHLTLPPPNPTYPYPHLLPRTPTPTYSHLPLPPPTPTYLYPHSPPSHPEINKFVWEFLDIICTPSGLREAPLNRVLPKKTTKTMSVTLSLLRSL